MKIRSGFVSNSSTSSFVIVGVKLEGELLERLIKETGVEWPGDELASEDPEDDEEMDEEEYEEALDDAASFIASKFGLKSDSFFIGVRVSDVYNGGESNFELSKVTDAIALVKEKLGVTDEQIVFYVYMSGG